MQYFNVVHLYVPITIKWCDIKRSLQNPRFLGRKKLSIDEQHILEGNNAGPFARSRGTTGCSFDPPVNLSPYLSGHMSVYSIYFI